MEDQKQLICPKCGSNNVNIQAVSITKNKGKGVGWWIYFLCIGWFIELMLWFFLTIPRLIMAMIGKNKKVKTVVKSVAVCQNCGNQFKP